MYALLQNDRKFISVDHEACLELRLPRDYSGQQAQVAPRSGCSAKQKEKRTTPRVLWACDKTRVRHIQTTSWQYSTSSPSTHLPASGYPPSTPEEGHEENHQATVRREFAQRAVRDAKRLKKRHPELALRRNRLAWFDLVKYTCSEARRAA